MRFKKKMERIHVDDKFAILRAMRLNRPFLLVGWNINDDMYAALDSKPSHSPTPPCRLDIICGALLTLFGPNELVPVTPCSGRTSYSLSTSEASTSLHEYLGYLSRPEPDRLDGQSMYLKDWHFARRASAVLTSKGDAVSTQIAPYNVPWAFDDDWLNWWFDIGQARDDYRFL
jgi:hypothetical protein